MRVESCFQGLVGQEPCIWYAIYALVDLDVYRSVFPSLLRRIVFFGDFIRNIAQFDVDVFVSSEGVMR